MYSLLVILPRAAKQHVAHRHGYHVTLDGVLIRADLEVDGDGMLYLDVALVTQPLDMVGVRMLAESEVELVTQLGARKVMATSTIYDDLDRLATNSGTGLEDVAPLFFHIMRLCG